jgi:hypothetical protein
MFCDVRGGRVTVQLSASTLRLNGDLHAIPITTAVVLVLSPGLSSEAIHRQIPDR